MKITEERLKQIIKEELERVDEQEEAQEESDTKTLTAFRKFLLNLSKNVGDLKGVSTNEIKTAAQLILNVLESMPKGEVSRYVAQTNKFLDKKLGGK